ncbi:MAG: hypothetical protein RMJ55_05010 [Roseiflexaceae bacterium]|nr:hypothetical protein [Roseiflexaceae bacterium]
MTRPRARRWRIAAKKRKRAAEHKTDIQRLGEHHLRVDDEGKIDASEGSRDQGRRFQIERRNLSGERIDQRDADQAQHGLGYNDCSGMIAENEHVRCQEERIERRARPEISLVPVETASMR